MGPTWWTFDPRKIVISDRTLDVPETKPRGIKGFGFTHKVFDS